MAAAFIAMQISTFLMFEGRAEEALTFYTSLFPASRIVSMKRYGAGEMGKEGTVQHAAFELNGQPFMAIDSPAPHGFTFTPSLSQFVVCDSAEEVDRLFAALAQDGQVMMPLDKYPFSQRFAWVQDRFGVSWQLSLP